MHQKELADLLMLMKNSAGGETALLLKIYQWHNCMQCMRMKNSAGGENNIATQDICSVIELSVYIIYSVAGNIIELSVYMYTQASSSVSSFIHSGLKFRKQFGQL
jgi:hypothetical protein